MDIPFSPSPRMLYPVAHYVKTTPNNDSKQSFIAITPRMTFRKDHRVVFIRFDQVFATKVAVAWRSKNSFTTIDPVPFDVDLFTAVINVEDITSQMEENWLLYADVTTFSLESVGPVSNTLDETPVGGDEVNGTVSTKDVTVWDGSTDSAGNTSSSPDDSLAP